MLLLDRLEAAVSRDQDLVELQRLMRQEGLTAWTASARLVESGRTERAQSTLFYHAKKIEATIAAEEAPSNADIEWVAAIREGQTLLIEEGAADLVRNALGAAGLKWTETPRKAFRFAKTE